MTVQCYLSEIYSAIQGEGPLVGLRQLFIRFSACDLRCVWCDTPHSLVRTQYCEIEEAPGNRDFKQINNPIEINELICFIKKLSPANHHSISLTGGEPLLQSNFMLSFLPVIKNEVLLPIYLETGGHRVNELRQVIDHIDYISMDFKLPSSAQTKPLWDEHKEFLDIAIGSKNVKKVWVKIVIVKNTNYAELLKSINIVKSLNSTNNIEIYLQPVTQIGNSIPPDEKEILELQFKLLSEYSNIRVLPQVHKLIGQM